MKICVKGWNLLFFSNEYKTDYAISNFPRAFISLWHGIVMGGGVGVSVHGTYRVACEKTVFAMPGTFWFKTTKIIFWKMISSKSQKLFYSFVLFWICIFYFSICCRMWHWTDAWCWRHVHSTTSKAARSRYI